MSKETRTKYQQFLESEKSLQEKGYAIVGNTVLIRKDLWDNSMEFTRQARIRFEQGLALKKQIGTVN